MQSYVMHLQSHSFTDTAIAIPIYMDQWEIMSLEQK